VGGDDFFTTLIVEKATGLKFQMIPFEGDGPSWQAAMGGKIARASTTWESLNPQIKAGNLIPLLFRRKPLRTPSRCAHP
jgi:tripartite-type tricarboxylate transporter receptor subunit TctC